MYYVRPDFLTVGKFSVTKREEARDWCAKNGITKFMSSDLHPWSFKLGADADKFNKIFGTPDVQIMWRNDVDISTLSETDAAFADGLRMIADRIESGSLTAVSYGRGIGDTRDIEQHIFEVSRK